MAKVGYLLTKFKLIMTPSSLRFHYFFCWYSIVLMVNLSFGQPLKNSLELPSLFSDNMVLQRNAEVNIWGQSTPFSEVEISVPWGQFSGTSNAEGKWEIILPTQTSNTPFDLQVCSQGYCKTLKNAVLGEVWLASGQSNMSMPLSGWLPTDPIEDSSKEIASAHKYPLRFFKVNQATGHRPMKTIKGTWRVSDSSNAPNFSATAYFFAKNLYQALQIPIGIINSSWGGTPVQSWADQSALKNIPAYENALSSIAQMDKKRAEYINWLKPLDHYPNTAQDYIANQWREIDFDDERFINETFDDSQWKTLKLPGNYADVFNKPKANDFDGIVWVRKTFIIDKLSKNYKFNLGLVDDMDFTFINGEFIGSTVGAPSFKEKQYDIPEGVLKEGKNTMAIRLVDTMGDARIYTPLSISNDQGHVISLEGYWKAYASAELYEGNFYKLNPVYLAANPRPNFVKLSAWTPTSLYNGMINPLVPYTIKGAIWYQGESNVGFEDEYKVVFRQMIESWRSKWQYDFPFYFVQIAPYNYNNGLSPALRDAQRKVATLANTGMIVTLDIGNPDNIHPAKKNEVGKRLSNLALEKTYGLHNKHLATYPVEALRKGNKIIITFDCQDSGALKIKTMNSDQIQISEDNINFYNAYALAKGCTVELISEKVKTPKYVRHAWSDSGTGIIVNSNGIPVTTFSIEVSN